MKKSIWFSLLSLILFSACSSEETAKEQSWGLAGDWINDKFQDSYETWRIKGDSIYINEGVLFEQRGYITLEEEQLIFTIGRGIYSLPLIGTSDEILSLTPERGTGSEPLTLLRSGNIKHDFYQSASVKVELPAIETAEARNKNQGGARIFLGPQDERFSLTQNRYSMQMGPDYHTASIENMDGFLGFKKATLTNEQANEFMALLYADRQMPMDLIYKTTLEMRLSRQHRLGYVVNPGHDGNNELLLPRNLFKVSGFEQKQYNEKDFDATAYGQNRRAATFYDRMFNYSGYRLVKLEANGKVFLDALELDRGLLKPALKQVMHGMRDEEKKPSFFVVADREATYGDYLYVLGAITAAHEELRDDFCQARFEKNYEEAIKDELQGNDILRAVAKQYPGKIIEISPETFAFYKEFGVPVKK